jgi:UDP-N-acetylmuramyl pentapeptide phosphotransferase/UDP-N-acetylglucosamine-1-phosphate transferase
MILQAALFILLGSIALTAFVLPKIVRVARYNELLDNPNGRSSHDIQVPRLGGVAFYIALMLGFYFIHRFYPDEFIFSVIPCLTILFVVGLKDDLVVLSAQSKLVMQLIVATFIIFDPFTSFLNLHGFLEVYHVHIFFKIALIYFMIIGIINALNMVDGIDGLASGLSLISLTAFALIFYFTQNHFSFLLMIATIGIILAFIPFNLSEKSNKVFMGDTGSMIIGFILAFASLQFLLLPAESLAVLKLPLAKTPLLLIFILFIPLMDTLRVMTVRIVRKKSPFKPDRTHLHHYFLDKLNWSHVKTSIVLTISAMLIAFIGYALCYYFHYLLVLSFLVSLFLASVILSYRVYGRRMNELRKCTTKRT